jgi:hypothetical protein
MPPGCVAAPSGASAATLACCAQFPAR